MFKSSRVKIILSIMGSLLILFAITLSVILLASYREIRNNNAEKLERYADLFLLNSQSQDQAPPEPNSESKSEQRTNQTPPDSKPENRPENNAEQRQRKDNAPIEERSDYQLSTFYSVVFSKDNEVLEVDDGDKDVYDEDELVEIARQVLEKNKDEGQIGELSFVVRTRPGYTLVAFLDNTFANSSMDMLIRNFLIVGTSALVVLFFISLFISKLIIRPLAENDKRQKQFISDASHELKTPISVISANADMLSREIGDNEWLSNIQYENERMGTLVRQLLDLSRAENAEIPMEQIDLSRVVAGDALAFESLAYDNGRTINSSIEDNIHIMGNRTQLEQLVSVLLDNAIRYSTGIGIEVSLKKQAHNAILTVANEGEEIPPEKIEHLFDRFYRVDEVRNSEDNHYGLGLSIARAVTERHKGKIEVSCPGGKVVFTVTLPV